MTSDLSWSAHINLIIFVLKREELFGYSIDNSVMLVVTPWQLCHFSCEAVPAWNMLVLFDLLA